MIARHKRASCQPLRRVVARSARPHCSNEGSKARLFGNGAHITGSTMTNASTTTT
jgi:hypothetical protein